MHRGRSSSGYRSGRGGRGFGSAGGYRGGARNGGQPDGALNGLFEKGVWKCNCTPKLPAEHFRVKKEGKNQGRWFYTCQKAQPDRCGFFLWDEDAEPRMQSAVLNNSISEPVLPPRSANAHPTNGASDEEELRVLTAGRGGQQAARATPPPPYSSFAAQAPTSARVPAATTVPQKRRLPWESEQNASHDDSNTDSDEGDDYPWPLTADEEQSLSQATEQLESLAGRTSQAGSSLAAPPVTPRKAIKFDEHSTPGGLRGAGAGLLTPDTTPQKDTHTSFAGVSAQHNQNLPETPTPLRFGQAPPAPDTPGSARGHSAEDELVTSLFEYLNHQSYQLNTEAANGLRALLDRHLMRDLGVIRGRDIARQTISKRDSTIVHQASRIAELETEMESLKARVVFLRESAGGGGGNSEWRKT